MTVLGQIDAGPGHQRIVKRAYASEPRWGVPDSPPSEYWDDWYQECELATQIIVNSAYSHASLTKGEGIQASKVRVIPLAYETQMQQAERPKVCQFDDTRPLKVLAIGRATLEKGMSVLLGAAELVATLPIVFDIVGNAQSVPATRKDRSNLRWHGHVARSQVHKFYRNADILAFPTLSDGFGITQLEAQCHGVPVIASANCGDVVLNRVNGRRLKENTATELAEVLREIHTHPNLINDWSSQSFVRDDFSINRITDEILNYR